MSAPTLIATSLKLGPGAALAHERVRASGAEARTRKPRPCKGRDGEDQLCIRRVIGARSAELLRALIRARAGPPHKPSPPDSKKTDARARALLLVVARQGA